MIYVYMQGNFVPEYVDIQACVFLEILRCERQRQIYNDIIKQ